MPTWLLVAVTIGAVIRLTRLVTADYLTAPIRDRLTRRWGDESKRAYLISCDWCSSMWVAPPVATAAILWPDNRAVIVALVALTASLAAGLVAKLDG
jgi:hypothetical protein